VEPFQCFTAYSMRRNRRMIVRARDVCTRLLINGWGRYDCAAFRFVHDHVIPRASREQGLIFFACRIAELLKRGDGNCEEWIFWDG
jgi:hypothetical protein